MREEIERRRRDTNQKGEGCPILAVFWQGWENDKQQHTDTTFETFFVFASGLALLLLVCRCRCFCAPEERRVYSTSTIKDDQAP